MKCDPLLPRMLSASCHFVPGFPLRRGAMISVVIHSSQFLLLWQPLCFTPCFEKCPGLFRPAFAKKSLPPPLSPLSPGSTWKTFSGPCCLCSPQSSRQLDIVLRFVVRGLQKLAILVLDRYFRQRFPFVICRTPLDSYIRLDKDFFHLLPTFL